MADPGAIRLSAMLDASPFIGGISQMVGGLSKMSNAMKLGSLAVGFFAFKTLKESIKELVAFEKAAVELSKVMGKEAAEPITRSVRKLSLVMPVARDELMNIAATAARLGVRGSKNILKFTETVAKIGIATDVSSGVAAEALARLAKQTRMPIDDIDHLGAAINELDNRMAITSAGIIDASARSAAELSRLGLTVPEILALNAALAEVSEGASRAGTRLNRLGQELGKPQKAATFADALGMTAEAFTKMRREDPLQVILDLIDVMQEGGDTADELAGGLDSRVRRAIQQLAQNEEGLAKAVAIANSEFEVAISLNREYAEFLDLVSSKQQILANNVNELQLRIGEELRPTIIQLQEAAISAGQWLNRMFSEPLQGNLTQQQIDELRNSIFTLWDQYEVKLIGVTYRQGVLLTQAKGHFVNMLNWFLDSEHQINTWWQTNQDIQQQIVDWMKEMDTDLRPAFFVTLQGMLDGAKGGLESLEDVWPRVIALAESFASVNLSKIAGDKVALTQFAEALVFLNKELLATRITQEMWNQGVINAVNIAALHAKTIQDIADAKKKLTAQTESDREAVVALIAKLQGEIDVLTLTKEAVFKLSKEYLAADKYQKNTLLTKWRTVQALEAEKEAYEELLKETERADSAREASAQSFRDEEVRLATEIWIRNQLIDGLQDEARARYEATLWLGTYTEEQRAAALAMYDELAARDAILEQRKKDEKQTDKDAKKTEARAERMKALIEKYSFATFESQLRLFERVVGDTADSMLDTFEAIVEGSGKAGEAVVAMIEDVVRMILQAQLQKLLFNLFGPLLFNEWPGNAAAGAGGGSGGLSFDRFGHPLQRAMGGPLNRGQLAIVGEKGPELFVPDSNGSVVPNSAFGQDVNVNVTYQIQALDSASVREMLAREQRTIAALTIDTINRHRALKRV